MQDLINMTEKREFDIGKANAELIVYQIMEVKNLISTLSDKVERNQEKIEQRISVLEIWKAGEEEKAKNGTIDVQKIILAAFSIASGVIAIGLALIQTGVVGQK